MRFHIITLFPDMCRSYANESILKRAQEKGVVSFQYYDPKDFTEKKFDRVDNRPYGGGPGMVIEAMPVVRAGEKALAAAKKKKGKTVVFFFSPSGTQFDAKMARTLAKKYTDVVLISGRYEGIDVRAKKILKAKELSIGPYILTGGELPAMVVADSVSRQIPGVLGTFESVEEERVASADVYTRPEKFTHKGKTYRVPKVLLTGNHKKIEEWKLKKDSRTKS